MMNKSIVVQYFLHFGDQILRYDKDRKLIFDLYRKLCEENPKKQYYIYKVETIREVIIKSEDVRQSLMNFG
jgi:hypothetical protein